LGVTRQDGWFVKKRAHKTPVKVNVLLKKKKGFRRRFF